MTCAKCGMTVGWDCDCDAEYNALIEEAAKKERAAPVQEDVTEDFHKWLDKHGFPDSLAG